MKRKGFSLIELLIVVAIILIIAAIAIPNLLRSKLAANEATAISSIRTINTAEITYNSTYPTTGYAGTLTALGPPASGSQVTSAAAGLLDNVIGCSAGATCNKSGYTFTLTGNYSAYSVTGTPITAGVTGQRRFFSDATGVLRYNVSAAATSDDAPIQ